MFACFCGVYRRSGRNIAGKWNTNIQKLGEQHAQSFVRLYLSVEDSWSTLNKTCENWSCAEHNNDQQCMVKVHSMNEFVLIDPTPPWTFGCLGWSITSEHPWEVSKWSLHFDMKFIIPLWGVHLNLNLPFKTMETWIRPWSLMAYCQSQRQCRLCDQGWVGEYPVKIRRDSRSAFTIQTQEFQIPPGCRLVLDGFDLQREFLAQVRRGKALRNESLVGCSLQRALTVTCLVKALAAHYHRSHRSQSLPRPSQFSRKHLQHVMCRYDFHHWTRSSWVIPSWDQVRHVSASNASRNRRNVSGSPPWPALFICKLRMRCIDMKFWPQRTSGTCLFHKECWNPADQILKLFAFLCHWRWPILNTQGETPNFSRRNWVFSGFLGEFLEFHLVSIHFYECLEFLGEFLGSARNVISSDLRLVRVVLFRKAPEGLRGLAAPLNMRLVIFCPIFK